MTEDYVPVLLNDIEHFEVGCKTCAKGGIFQLFRSLDGNFMVKCSLCCRWINLGEYPKSEPDKPLDARFFT